MGHYYCEPCGGLPTKSPLHRNNSGILLSDFTYDEKRHEIYYEPIIPGVATTTTNERLGVVEVLSTLRAAYGTVVEPLEALKKQLQTRGCSSCSGGSCEGAAPKEVGEYPERPDGYMCGCR